MSGSTFGTIFKISTWGESHGKAIGVVVDGCPAGLHLTAEDIQIYLDRRKPGQSNYTTSRQESDRVEILSGTFQDMTTGTPISMLVWNNDQHSGDYSNIANCYRPGHADYTYDAKYGFRDYRGGGRSSGRETIGRVAAGAIACKMLKELHIDLLTYTKSIGPVSINYNQCMRNNIEQNPFRMPDLDAANRTATYLADPAQQNDSVGGVIECIISGVPAGIGDPVFEKLDANLSKAALSIGAVKGIEFGTGFDVAKLKGSQNNDPFYINKDGKIAKRSNRSGGILGGMSDGSEIVFRLAVKPTPSISMTQHTVTKDGQETELTIQGRHDPIIVPRAIVVVESMAAITILDSMLANMTSRFDYVKSFYNK